MLHILRFCEINTYLENFGRYRRKNLSINKIFHNYEQECTTYSKNFSNILCAHALYPHITVPTRITSTTQTLIDNIFSNVFDKIITGGSIYFDLSDHLPIFVVIKQTEFPFNIKHKDQMKMKRKENVNTIRALNYDLSQDTWEDVLDK